MARRILTSIYALGLADETAPSDPADLAASDEAALAIERQGAVLLKNEGLLPLSADARRILVVGAHADRGVPSGGGSSQVVPRGGAALSEPVGRNRAMIFDPSSPLDAIRRQFPRARVDYDDGRLPGRTAKAAAAADAAIVFADQWLTETADAPDLSLPFGQDRLIESVARANPRTVVVLETGGPVLMPWIDLTAAVLEAWYPGQKGGEAIAEILSGAVNPSGRLPLTFPSSESQLPHRIIQGDPKGAPLGPVGRGGRYGRTFVADYGEGADVGYKWFLRRGERALFPFGYGLSYTTFALSGLTASAEGTRVTVSAKVRNSGAQSRSRHPAVLCVRTDGREYSAAARRLGQNRSRARRRARGQRFGRSAPACDLRRGARACGESAPGDYQVTAGFDAERRSEAATIHLDAATLPP